MNLIFRFAAASLILAASLLAQQPAAIVSGTVVDPATDQPVEAAAVTLHARGGGPALRTAATDTRGGFAFRDVPFGEYTLGFGRGGSTAQESPAFVLNAVRPAHDAGRLALAGDAPIALEKFEVSARQEAFYNSIDRKVYNVGQDIQSATGSASDLLQNVPSIQVDVEGEVSLRGDSNVQILVNGKSSALLNGGNRAAALEQMSAGRVARVEVITNPSAKYSPEGTGGIINLVLKEQDEPGYFASTRVNVGNEGRYNASLTANFNPGKYNIFGGASIRQDDRSRLATEERVYLDGNGGVLFSTGQRNTDRTRPLSRRGEFGIDYELSDRTEFGAALEYSRSKVSGDGRRTNQTRDASGALTADFDRVRTGPESEEEFEFELNLGHEFDDDRELTIELSRESGTENEEENYATTHRLPSRPTELENTGSKNTESETELSADYSHPLASGAKLELGYSLEAAKTDSDFRRRLFDPVANAWLVDTATTNRFVYESAVHSFYATYGRPVGQFGFLGGLRFEQTLTKTDQMTAAIRDEHDYARVYPSLHLTYNLTDTQRLQLSYSHRVNRPDGDELNPYPSFDDPLDVETGNPDLEPEDIHSIEGGYEYHRQDTTYLATIYHRMRYNGVTDVTTLVGGNTLVTRPENLSTSNSSGLELGATRRWNNRLSLNFSANVYRNQIDARNLGFNSRRTAYAWDAKLNTNWDVSRSLALQLTSSYTARRLTAQGERFPSHITNLGARYTFKDRRTSVVLTVSDLFDSLRNRTQLDTPTLRSESTQRRSSRIVYLGFIYSFGKGSRDADEAMQFDEAL